MGVARWHSALAGAVLSLAMPAAAAAAWTVPAPVPGSSGTPVVPSLELSSSGVGLITTELGTSQTLGSVVSAAVPGPLHPISPHLRLLGWGFHDDSNIVGAGYERAHGGYAIKAAFGPPGGPLGRVTTVARGLTTPTLAIDANGRGTAAIAYTKDRGLYLAVWRSGHGFEKPVRMSGADHALALPAVKVDPRGDVLAAWTSSGAQPRCRCRPGKHSLLARIRSPSGHLRAIKRLGATGDAGDIALAFDKGRKALVGWVDDRPNGGVRLAYAPAGGRFQQTDTVEPFNLAGADHPPASVRVAFTSNGHAQAAWTSPSGGTIFAGELSGGRIQAPVAVTTGTQNPTLDSYAAGPRGDLVLTWTQGGPSAPQVFASVLTGLFLGPPELVAAGGNGSAAAIDPVTDAPFAVFATKTGLQYSTRTPAGS
jgi:hypothetical protein